MRPRKAGGIGFSEMTGERFTFYLRLAKRSPGPGGYLETERTLESLSNHRQHASVNFGLGPKFRLPDAAKPVPGPGAYSPTVNSQKKLKP